MLAVGFFQVLLIKLTKLSCIFSLLRGFFFLITNVCCILLNSFSESIDMIVWFFFSSLLIWWITLIDFLNIEPVLHIRDKSYLVTACNSFYTLCGSFAHLLLRMFLSICMRAIGLHFSYNVFVLFSLVLR
jgi:hypothetical protein